MAITVFLEEGNSVFMKGIAEKLRKDKTFTVILSGEQSLFTRKYLFTNLPDIFIHDIDTNGERLGFPLLREIRKTCGGRVQVIAISDHEDTGTFLTFFHLGGAGYMLQVAAEEEIVPAVRTVSRDCHFLGCRLQNTLLKKILAVSPPMETESILSLSARERDVLSRIQKGDAISDIADQFSLSPDTIENNKKSIMKKLGIHTVTDLRIKILFADLD